MTGRPRLVRLAALAAAALFVPLLFAARANGADVASFGQPTATAAYGREVVFEQPITLAAAPRRIEVLVRFPTAPGPVVSVVPSPGTGSRTLSYSLDTATDHLTPNTQLSARWRVTAADGSTQLGPEVGVLYADTRFQWKSRSGSVVRVHWYEGSDGFGQRALQIGEKAVADTSALLGVTESDPIDFYVYADQQAFYDALGPDTRENVGGQARPDIRTLFALITPNAIDDPWVGIVIPHELVHLVLDTAVRNPYHYPPRWLNEGLAVYLSQGYDASDRSAVEAAARDGSLIPLDGLEIQFPTGAERFSLAYSESVAAVDYLVRTHGREALIALVRSYADGRSDDEAFSAALGIDAAAFDRAWRADLHAAEPHAYGPQPAPAGPLPPGWESASGAPGAPAGGGPASAAPSAPSAPVAGSGGDPNGAAVGIGLVALVVGALGVALVARDRSERRRQTGAEPGATPPADESWEPPA